MLDDPLTPLLAPVSDLRGVGPATVEKLVRLTGGGRVRDLLFHLPDSFVDRRRQRQPGRHGGWRGGDLAVEVAGHEPASKPSQPWRVRVTDGAGFAELAIWDKQRLAAVIRAMPAPDWW